MGLLIHINTIEKKAIRYEVLITIMIIKFFMKFIKNRPFNLTRK